MIKSPSRHARLDANICANSWDWQLSRDPWKADLDAEELLAGSPECRESSKIADWIVIFDCLCCISWAAMTRL